MIIALDFDDTYTADAKLWEQFISLAESAGHRVVMVTCRRDTDENREECLIQSLPTHAHYFTGLSPKRWFMEQRGVKVDIWVDDMPESIKEGR
jgi:hypothetical protein